MIPYPNNMTYIFDSRCRFP